MLFPMKRITDSPRSRSMTRLNGGGQRTVIRGSHEEGAPTDFSGLVGSGSSQGLLGGYWGPSSAAGRAAAGSCYLMKLLAALNMAQFNCTSSVSCTMDPSEHFLCCTSKDVCVLWRTLK